MCGTSEQAPGEKYSVSFGIGVRSPRRIVDRGTR
jgi:hypothetical protein